MSDRKITIEAFTPANAPHFQSLNEEWLERYFRIEEHDREVFSNPEREIIAKGGEIFFAKLDGAVIGTCALIKIDERTFELAKMAVTESSRGLGIGKRLALAVIERARASGASSLVLESNTKLIPAIALYRSLGFEEAPRPAPSSYERSNIYMQLSLHPT